MNSPNTPFLIFYTSEDFFSFYNTAIEIATRNGYNLGCKNTRDELLGTNHNETVDRILAKRAWAKARAEQRRKWEGTEDAA